MSTEVHASLAASHHPVDSVFTLTRDQVMTAREVADLLQMPVSTVYYLARCGELPAHRFGRMWRFLRPRIEQCLWS